VAILDLLDLHLKTGISHRALRPRLALIDPLNTLSLPPGVTASTGIDVVTHALESYTARPYTARPRPETPTLRPPYCGSNPISDVWCEKALRLAATYLPRAVRDGSDREARTNMLLASTYAGFGFGNAGVHVPHAMGYPIAGRVQGYVAPGYPDAEPMVPHGLAVAVGAPAAFRFTGPAAPERHLRAAGFLGADVSGGGPEKAGEVLAATLAALMRKVGLPVGLRDLGYTEADVPALAAGAYQQQRLLVISPRPVTEEDLVAIFREAL
jgi:alcohol dehydrogenase class IV